MTIHMNMTRVDWHERQRSRRVRRSILLLSSSVLAMIVALPAATQTVRPSDQRPGLPEPSSDATVRARVLPRIDLSVEPGIEALRAGRTVYVADYVVVGGPLLDPQTVDALLSGYREREVGWTDLESLRISIDDALAEAGYVTSRADFPEQAVRDGRLELHILEGRLERVDVTSTGRMPTEAIRKRLARVVSDVVNAKTIEEQLSILKQDPRIATVNAELRPGSEPGSSVLAVRIDDATPVRLRAGYANDLTRAIGEHRGWVEGTHRNLFGFADTVFLSIGWGRTYRDIDARYDVPIGSFGTVLGAHARRTKSEVIEDDFDLHEIESRSKTFGLHVGQDLYRSKAARASAELVAEWRRAHTDLDGFGFNLTAGAEEGESTVSVVRLALDWSWRERSRAIAVRSLVSFGVDALGSTQNPGDVPDSRFVAWLGQAQAVQRMPFLDAQWVARVDLQIADSALLGIERIGMGGRRSVRGYRENEIVTDNGVVGSLELRVPIYRASGNGIAVTLAPFIDSAHGWNDDEFDPPHQDMLGTGLAAYLEYQRWLTAQVHWGYDLTERSPSLDAGPQDHGVHLSVQVSWP